MALLAYHGFEPTRKQSPALLKLRRPFKKSSNHSQPFKLGATFGLFGLYGLVYSYTENFGQKNPELTSPYQQK